VRRIEGLRLALDSLLKGVPLAAVPVLDAAGSTQNDPVLLALASFSRYGGLDYEGAVVAADRAVLAAGSDARRDPDAVLLSWVVRGLASASWRTPQPGQLDVWTTTAVGITPTGDPLRDAAGLFDRLEAESDLAHFIRYLAAEAAVACSRFDLAAEIIELTGPLPPFLVDEAGESHPFITMIMVMRVRALAFHGRIADAAALLSTPLRAPRPPIATLLIRATDILIRGNAGERAGVRALADRLELARPHPSDYIAVGCYVLAAWGLVAIGDVRRSARVALFAGPQSLDRMSFVAQGLTLEVLVSAAIDEGDQDAVEAWRERADPLLRTPIANSSAARLIARVELVSDRPGAAVEWAERSIEMARAEGRVVEAAEGELVAARARQALSALAAGGVRLARGALIGTEATLDVRRSAARQLRASGRRLQPVAGSEWSGLSARERDIALMVAEGLTNREIGLELHLSEHTVRAHVSRVLAAFGAASRFAVAARVAELFPAPPEDLPAPLTPRQLAVAERIAAGLGNAEIGRELELSVKTVEKHIGEIFRRWNVSSRVGIARIVRR
jgi:DNA-binding NarL/FixJ family response regulator